MSDAAHPPLSALHAPIASGGRLMIQTVHPWAARGDAPYQNAWRTESFDTLAVAFPSPIPWCYRTVSSWHVQIALAGLTVVQLDEPPHPQSGAPLSLLFHCEAA